MQIKFHVSSSHLNEHIWHQNNEKKNYPDSSVHKIVVFRPFRLLSIKKVIWSEWLDGQRATATFINHSLVREARVNMARSHGWIDTLKQKEKNTIFCASLRVSAWTNQPKKKEVFIHERA